jgi:hypothetical protein
MDLQIHGSRLDHSSGLSKDRAPQKKHVKRGNKSNFYRNLESPMYERWPNKQRGHDPIVKCEYTCILFSFLIVDGLMCICTLPM